MKAGIKIASRASKFLVIGWLFFHGVHVYAASANVYTVRVKDDLSGLDVMACFRQAPPSKLVSYDTAAIRHLRTVALVSGGAGRRSLQPKEQTISLPLVKPGDCVVYGVDFNDEMASSRFASRQSKNQQILIDIHSWLWFPDNFDYRQHMLEITFELPDGMVVSSPWQVLAQNGSSVTYHYVQRPPEWAGRIAIGRFKTKTRDKGAAKIQIAILKGRQPVDSDKVVHWIDKNLDALLTAYGKFPVHALQLLVVPIGKDREPVRWGQVMRGGGDAVHLYIDQTRPLTEFLDDWVLIHELSHLLHLRVEKSSWLSEGLASYYQNVLRARSGLLSEKQAWQELHDGFQRGIRGTPPGKSLAQISNTMMRTRSFMRVYWSGAAISLLADYRLRRQSNNQQSLDTALEKLSQCCLPAKRYWTGVEMMKKLDSLTRTDVFTDLYREHLPSSNFPRLSSVYSDLGLVVNGDTIELDQSAPKVFIRRAIMAAR